MKECYIYIDESGTLGRNDNFCYGGFVVFGREKRDAMVRKMNKIEKEFNWATELKASSLTVAEKQLVINRLKVDQLICISSTGLKISKSLYPRVDTNCLKLDMLEMLICETLTDATVDKLTIHIDEQNFSSNLAQDLYNRIQRKFKFGSLTKKGYVPVDNFIDTITIRYVDSKSNELVRVADFIANYSLNQLNNGNDITNIYQTLILL